VLQPESIQNTLVREFTGSFFWTMPMGVAVYLAVVGAEHSVRHMMATSEREVQIARLSQQLSGAQLAALQAQLNPHFLFNTLNTLAVLVDEGDRTTSARIIEQLSDVLRRTLTPHQSSEVRLGAELQLVRQYLAIEQVRFADRLRTVFEINEDANIAAVPSFAIQHLVENVLAALDITKPHVVFLDVQMPDLDGLEVIRLRTPDRMPLVIFLTAFDRYAVRAFAAEALDYLLKPVSAARFAGAMKRLTKRLQTTRSSACEKIAVPTNHGIVLTPLDDIDWIEAAGNYARLWIAGKGHLLRESLNTIERRVRTKGFYRVHRRALVRLACVRAVIPVARRRWVVVLDSGTRIPVSRRRRERFAAIVKERGTLTSTFADV
jgi:two-component system LytT family response regulator